MNDRDAVLWLHRRAGFGLSAEQLAEAVARGPAAEIERLLAPTKVRDAWDDSQLPLQPRLREGRLYAVDTWLTTLATTTEPLVERMAWLWHGHFVSGLDKVKVARLMVNQVRLFRRLGLGSFPELLAAVAIDPAMMVYLDLRTSTGRRPNENFARELLELFTLGTSAFVEADVPAAAAALTGWTQRGATSSFVPRRHDDSPQRFLGIDGVHDLATVVAAITAHPAMATFVAAAVAGELLGTTEPDVVARIADAFSGSGFEVRELVRATLTAGLDGASAPIVLGPVQWATIAQRVTGATVPGERRVQLLRDARQLPMYPPNVAGWPGGRTWFAADSLVARVNLAQLIAEHTPDESAAALAARDADPGALAPVLGLPEAGFGAATLAALAGASPGTTRLAAALVSPEFWLV